MRVPVRQIAFRPRTHIERARVHSLVDVELDPVQRAAIDLPEGRALLVLGEAGHGKTTVLLHRIARLWRQARRSLHTAVLVPTEGLARLLQPLLRRLGVDVEVCTFDRFIAKQGRRAFRRLPRVSDETPPNVMRLKRHPALRLALAELAHREAGVVDDDVDARRSTRVRVTRGDLQHLFGDRELMDRVAEAASLPAHVIADVLERSRIQFVETTEREWSHVTDRERLVAVDHRPLDEGTATAHAATIDVEDYAVLFELDRMRAARRGEKPVAPRAFDLIAIDEAQELAPLELALIGRSLAPRGTLIVSGDADQHTDETTTFRGWENVIRELGVGELATSTLEIGYRCPPEVVDLARGVRAASHPAACVHVFSDDLALAHELGAALDALVDRDPRASVLVVCRRPMTARWLVGALREHVPARVVFDGRFSRRGVQVSLPSEVKGLEVDYVVIADASAIAWPDVDEARRAMYVALTRARHQAVIACTGPPTRIFR
jgi:DNA helicase II / ATP-dependent DNA helicase PcrA